MQAKTVNKAIKTLNGVIQIARNEQLRRGVYISDEIVNERLAAKGAICGGHQACFVGSLFIAAKGSVTPLYDHGYVDEDIFSVSGRHDYMKNRPYMRLAYEAANEAAYDVWAKSPDKFRESETYIDHAFFSREASPHSGWAEALFEEGMGGFEYDDVRDVVIEVCNLAKKRIRKEYADVLKADKKAGRKELVAA